MRSGDCEEAHVRSGDGGGGQESCSEVVEGPRCFVIMLLWIKVAGRIIVMGRLALKMINRLQLQMIRRFIRLRVVGGLK